MKNFQLSYAENELGLGISNAHTHARTRMRQLGLLMLLHTVGDEVLLQFGRVGKDKFNMDVRHPLSLFQVHRHAFPPLLSPSVPPL